MSMKAYTQTISKLQSVQVLRSLLRHAVERQVSENTVSGLDIKSVD